MTPQIEQLKQLIKPTWDGDLISKHHRDKLVEVDIVNRCKGFNFLSPYGIELCINLGLLRETVPATIEPDPALTTAPLPGTGALRVGEDVQPEWPKFYLSNQDDGVFCITSETCLGQWRYKDGSITRCPGAIAFKWIQDQDDRFTPITPAEAAKLLGRSV